MTDVQEGPRADTDRRANSGSLRTARLAFREWRRSRPFWAGIFALASGLLVLFPPFASLKFGDVVVTLNTFSGITALVIGVVIIACGVSFWTRPPFRFVAGIVTLLLSLAAIVTANLGTFLIGTLLGILGAALGIAWSPKQKRSRRSRRRDGDAEGTAGPSGEDAQQQEASPAGASQAVASQASEGSQYADAGGRV